MAKPRPNFPLSMRLQGQHYRCLGVDIINGWFWAGAPDDMPGSKCWLGSKPRARQVISQQHGAWLGAVLTRAVYVELERDVWTLMTPELVQRLGGTHRDDTAAADLVHGYFSALAWLLPDNTGYRECDLPSPMEAVLTKPPVTAEQRRALVTLPGPNMLSCVKAIAASCHTSVHRVWRSWYASDFICEYNATIRTSNQTALSTASLPPDLAAIGVGN